MNKVTSVVLLALALGLAAPAFAKPKASDQARKDAAHHAAKGDSTAAAAANKRAESGAKQEAIQARNASKKKK